MICVWKVDTSAWSGVPKLLQPTSIFNQPSLMSILEPLPNSWSRKWVFLSGTASLGSRHHGDGDTKDLLCHLAVMQHSDEHHTGCAESGSPPPVWCWGGAALLTHLRAGGFTCTLHRCFFELCFVCGKCSLHTQGQNGALINNRPVLKAAHRVAYLWGLELRVVFFFLQVSHTGKSYFF